MTEAQENNSLPMEISAAPNGSKASAEAADPLAPRFQELTRQWKQASQFSSSLTEITRHAAYRQIIELGKGAIPLILDELRREPHHWFAALKAITGEDPVSPPDRGKVPRMTHAWLEWGKAHGY